MKVRETAIKYQTQKKPFTYQDYLNLPEDGNRYQVINGELVMAPSPLPLHQIVSGELFLSIGNYVKDKKLGMVFSAPLDVVLSEDNVLQPDILFISKERQQIITDKNIAGAPDLVIEILSPATAYYDLFDKKEIYQKFGVKEYWIVDPMRRWMELYHLQKGQFELIQHLEKTGSVKSRVLQNFKLNLEEIFKETVK